MTRTPAGTRVALVPRGGDPLADLDLDGDVVFVLGSERGGLPREVVEACDVQASIPQAGDALIEMILRTANGRLTASESLGHREYVMTKLYRSA